MITVVETEPFIKKAAKLMTEREKRELIHYVAIHPEIGDIIAGTGGVRKLRFARPNQGKSGSYRVVYYFYNRKNPVLLFSIFGKNEKANLSDQEKKELYKIVQAIKKGMKS